MISANNYLPNYRKHRLAVRSRIAQWRRLLLGYGAIVAICVMVGASVAPASDVETYKQIELIETDEAKLIEETLFLEKEIKTSSIESDILEQIAQKPDWSLLLSLIANRSPRDLVLNRCLLSKINKAGVIDSANQNMLKIKGMALSQESVIQYVSNLKDTQVFTDVTLVTTSRQEISNREVIAFNLECQLVK